MAYHQHHTIQDLASVDNPNRGKGRIPSCTTPMVQVWTGLPGRFGIFGWPENQTILHGWYNPGFVPSEDLVFAVGPNSDLYASAHTVQDSPSKNDPNLAEGEKQIKTRPSVQIGVYYADGTIQDMSFRLQFEVEIYNSPSGPRIVYLKYTNRRPGAGLYISRGIVICDPVSQTVLPGANSLVLTARAKTDRFSPRAKKQIYGWAESRSVPSAPYRSVFGLDGKSKSTGILNPGLYHLDRTPKDSASREKAKVRGGQIPIRTIGGIQLRICPARRNRMYRGGRARLVPSGWYTSELWMCNSVHQRN